MGTGGFQAFIRTQYVKDVFCFSELILVFEKRGCVSASTYKCNSETGNTLDLIVDAEPLHVLDDGWGPEVAHSDESLKYFGIIGCSIKHVLQFSI